MESLKHYWFEAEECLAAFSLELWPHPMGSEWPYKMFFAVVICKTD